MRPTQKCNALLHFLQIGMSFGKFPHVFQVANGKSLNFWKFRQNVPRKVFDEFCSIFCVGDNRFADLPVEQNHFAVRSQNRLVLGGFDLRLDRF